MRIFCNVKDYYDYLVGIYGIDNKIIYDRRECSLLNKVMIRLTHLFNKDKLKSDSVKKWRRCWNIVDGKWVYGKFLTGDYYYYILEIGYCHIYIQVERYLDENGDIVINPEIIEIKDKCDKKTKYPMSIITLESYGTNICRDISYLHVNEYSDIIPNPILSSSYLSGLIDADFVYNELYNYFISVNDKDIKDNRNDVQKLESHGFDKKTSFRGKNK